MALNWDISNIADHEQLWHGEGDDAELDGVTNLFIWTSMATGLGKNWSLDAEFAPEFYARLKMLEKVGGPLLTRGGEPVDITPEMVRRHIGLHTNVSPKTRAAFLKSLNSDLDGWARQYTKQTQEVPA